ncbi:hypothetical protein EW145_g6646 [Phellinidium pouzarii]|uniref:Uncharacterized protein n=1 Tax=Phellinidium pouzarii TaxID=167371 RepID=A0A4S4KVW7_9AGAM|nr:hypothetical protein EW145_g6646 [Phellinidium pouzarii]
MKIFGLHLRDIFAPPRRLRLDVDPLRLPPPQSTKTKTKARNWKSRLLSRKPKASTGGTVGFRSLGDTEETKRGRSIRRAHDRPLDLSMGNSSVIFNSVECNNDLPETELKWINQKGSTTQIVDTLHFSRYKVLKRRGALSAVDFGSD